MKARRGITLVEVMLAGAIAALLTFAFMEGLTLSARISRENSELLAAEGYAWDTAWKWLNKKDEDLNGTTSWKYYPDSSGAAVLSNECPVVWRESSLERALCFVRVRSEALTRGAETVSAKRIDVDVEWGAQGDRRRLNDLGSSSAKSFNVPITVYKGPIDRGE